jgi:hypothetical protein
MQTLLDYNSRLPAHVNITDGKTADNKGACEIQLLKASFIFADKCYNDFSLLNVWDSHQAYFVIRHKDNIKFKTVKELELSEKGHLYVLKYKMIKLTGVKTKDTYQKRLRSVAL